MSSSTSDLRSTLRNSTAVATTGRTLLAPIRAVAFWLAVALPFLYLPLLAVGLNQPSVITAFVALLTTNAVALMVGHSYALD